MHRLQKMLGIGIALVFLTISVVCASGVTEEAAFDASDWARADIERVIALGVIESPRGEDLREAIRRESVAEAAARLVAIEFGSNLKSYCTVMNYRGLAENGVVPHLSGGTIAQELGIIKGREDGSLDEESHITRQEAAVMLARTYRAYQGTMPESLQPIAFVDQDEIASWAIEDVRLMHHLGIMSGIDGKRFDPEGSYTVEQCLVTLLRLHEKAPFDGTKEKNPFEIPAREVGRVMQFTSNERLFAVETKDYYILARMGDTPALGSDPRYIEVIGRDLSRRVYDVAILRGKSERGSRHADPVFQAISEDGTKLLYTAVLTQDAYHVVYDYETGKTEQTLLFRKGVYTVTMDLQTGAQSYTHAD